MPVTLQRRPAARRLSALAVPLLTAGALATLGPAAGATTVAAAAAASCHNLTGIQPPSPGTEGTELSSVAVIAACNAWAVGDQDSNGIEQTLIEHWNGSVWKVVPSPSPGTSFSELNSVRGISASDVWAVGDFSSGSTTSLILHWDGHTWKQVPAPTPAHSFNGLAGVRAVSAKDAWAVGIADGGTSGSAPLILHWNGTTWSRSATPKVGANAGLAGVAATSSTDVWAVGGVNVAAGPRQGPVGHAHPHPAVAAVASPSLILHWDGRVWKRVPSPNPSTGLNELTAVGVHSATSAWAVGESATSVATRGFTLHWNGHTWTKVASLNPGGTTPDDGLFGVTVPAANTAFAVGFSNNKSLILRWNGKSWAQVTSPNLGSNQNFLAGVAASSPSNAWAVGDFRDTGSPSQALALHCC